MRITQTAVLPRERGGRRSRGCWIAFQDIQSVFLPPTLDLGYDLLDHDVSSGGFAMTASHAQLIKSFPRGPLVRG
jgi:hypothetical protein